MRTQNWPGRIYFYLKRGPAYRRIYPITLILPHQTHLGTENALFLLKNNARSIKLPFFCRTKRTSEPKMPYFYLKKGPNLSAYLRRPRQEHSRARNHYKKRAKVAPATGATFMQVEPDPGGDPLKNPKKHHKKPLPPREVYGREEGGWLGWLGWAGWVTGKGIGFRFCRTKRTSEPKMSYFYLKKNPRSRKCLILNLQKSPRSRKCLIFT